MQWFTATVEFFFCGTLDRENTETNEESIYGNYMGVKKKILKYSHFPFETWLDRQKKFLGND